jgi:hypothetical protein
MLCGMRTLCEDKCCEGRKSNGMVMIATMNVYNVLLSVKQKLLSCLFWVKFGEIMGQIDPR